MEAAVRMFHEANNLAGYLEGSLDPAAKARVEKHLKRCARCRAGLADLESVGRVLDAAGKSAGPVRYDADLWTRVQAQISTPHRQAPLTPRWALAGGSFALAAAAICMVAMFEHGGIRRVQPSTASNSIAIQAPDRPAPGGSMKKTRVASAPLAQKPASARADRQNGVRFRPLNALTDTRPIPMQPSTPAATPPAGVTGRPAKDLVAELPRESAPAAAFGYRDQPTVGYVGNAEANRRDRALGVNDQHQSAAIAGRMGENSAGGASHLGYYNTQSGGPQAAASAPGSAVAPGEIAFKLKALPTAKPAPAASGVLDIAADKAPRMPGHLGVSDGRVDHLALGGATRRVAPEAKDRIVPYRSTPVETGVSTLKGQELLSQAESAFAAGKLPVAVRLYDDADKAGLSTSERRLAEVRRGDIALRNNDAVSAIKLYRAAIAKRKDAEVLAKLGDASEKAGLVKEAIDAYREALSLSPDYKPAKDGLERVKKP